MPIYEYKCQRCGHEQDHLHRRREETAPPCASCGEDALERRLSLSAFHLKGSGWYTSDYGKGSSSTSSGGSGASSSAA